MRITSRLDCRSARIATGAALLAVACSNPWAQGEPAASAAAPAATHSGPVPLQRLALGDMGGWIELEAVVHGQASQWLLDTGASRNLVAPGFVDRHHLATGPPITLRTALGTLRGNAVDLPTLRVGALERSGLQAVMLDPGSLVGEAGRDVDGVLGVPFLRGLGVTLDLRSWTIRLSVDATPAGCPDGLQPWPLRRHAGLPVIGIQRGDQAPQSWLLDTGNPAALVQLIDEPAVPPPGLPLPGTGWMSLLPLIRLGPATRTQVPIVQLPAPDLRRALAGQVEGLAGTALIDGSVLHLDLAQDLACLEPGSVAMPGSFGMPLEWRQGRLVVGLLVAGGPAEAAGLREGEVVHRWADADPTPLLQHLWARVQGQPSVTLQVGAPPRELTVRRAHFAPVLP